MKTSYPLSAPLVLMLYLHIDLIQMQHKLANQWKIWAKKNCKHSPYGILTQAGLQRTCESSLTLTDVCGHKEKNLGVSIPGITDRYWRVIGQNSGSLLPSPPLCIVVEALARSSHHLLSTPEAPPATTDPLQHIHRHTQTHACQWSN